MIFKENTNTVQELAETEAARLGVTCRPITISDACIIEINNRLFLLILINFNNSETVLVIRISRQQALDLIRNGIRNCPVFTTLPAEIQRKSAELLCVFVVNRQAFLVFETERAQERFERIFVVRIPLCPILDEDD